MYFIQQELTLTFSNCKIILSKLDQNYPQMVSMTLIVNQIYGGNSTSIQQSTFI
jgi:hypothetical protein